MALDNLSAVGIDLPLWFVLPTMNGAFDCTAATLGEADLGAGGF
jgi:hypothetical protein